MEKVCMDFAFKLKISLLVVKLFGFEQNKHLLLFGFFLLLLFLLKCFNTFGSLQYK